MLRKTTAAVVLAGALALGTASATSLGTFDDVGFAASDVTLLDCELTTSVIDLIPDVPDTTTTGSDLTDFLALDTFALDAVDLSTLPSACQDELLDVVFIGDDGLGNPVILETIEGLDLRGQTLSAVDLTQGGTSVLDVANVNQIRLVLTNQ